MKKKKLALFASVAMVVLTLVAIFYVNGTRSKADNLKTEDVGITINVIAPEEWNDGVALWPWNVVDSDGIALDAAFNPDIVPSSWPGWYMEKSTLEDGTEYYSYTMKCSGMGFCIANVNGTRQTEDIDGYTEQPGTYWVSQVNLDSNTGMYKFYISDEKFNGAEAPKKEVTIDDNNQPHNNDYDDYTGEDGITLNVVKPESWDGVSLWPWNVMKDDVMFDSAFNPDIVPAAWPGWAMDKKELEDGTEYYSITLNADSFGFVFANPEGTEQTLDLSVSNEKSGTFWFSKPVYIESNNKWNFTVSDECFDGNPVVIENPNKNSTTEEIDYKGEGITLHVEKPISWNGVSVWNWNSMIDEYDLDCVFNPEIVPSAWPGWNMSMDSDGYYTYTIMCDKTDAILADNEGINMTIDIVNLTEGEYWFTDFELLDNGNYSFTQTQTKPSNDNPIETADPVAQTTTPATSSPVTTKTPVSTESPVESKEPIVSEKPDKTETPEKSEKPQETKKPSEKNSKGKKNIVKKIVKFFKNIFKR